MIHLTNFDNFHSYERVPDCPIDEFENQCENTHNSTQVPEKNNCLKKIFSTTTYCGIAILVSVALVIGTLIYSTFHVVTAFDGSGKYYFLKAHTLQHKEYHQQIARLRVQ